ncbi:MAG: transposase [Deltaproteobacteria bacterium]|jgi:transposase|nr:transposase [Deltaproteobacteria bacterium]
MGYCDKRGCPIKIDVYPGNVRATTTFASTVETLRNNFKLSKIIIIAARGRLGPKNIGILKGLGGIDWLTPLSSDYSQLLVDKLESWPNFDDELNCLEVITPDFYPGERLIVYRDPRLAKPRRDVLRTSLSAELFSSSECVRQYKKLTEIERAFRSIKTADAGPVSRYSETRIKAHFCICLLAYYVIWRVKEAWRELIFPAEAGDEDGVADGATKDKKNHVLPAQPFEGAPATSFQALLRQLSTVVQVEARLLLKDKNPLVFNVTSNLNSHQAKALDLLSKIKV